MILGTIASFFGPIVAAAVVVAGGAKAYKSQKAADLSAHLTERRRQVYAEYLVSISKSISAESPEQTASANDQYRAAKQDLFLASSDSVIKCAGKLAEMFEDKVESSSDGQLTAYCELVSQMRSETFEESKLSIDELKKLSPFSDPNDKA